MNVATLHYYFPTKEDLIKAVVGHAMSRFQSTLSSDGSSTERLRAHFKGLRRLANDEPELFAVMGELMLRATRDKSLAGIIAKMHDYWHGTLRTMLRGARDDGALPGEIDPDGMAAVIVSTLKGVYLLPARSAPPEAFDKSLRQLERLLALRA